MQISFFLSFFSTVIQVSDKAPSHVFLRFVCIRMDYGMWPKLGCFAVNIGLKYAVMFLGLLNNELCSSALLRVQVEPCSRENSFITRRLK